VLGQHPVRDAHDVGGYPVSRQSGAGEATVDNHEIAFGHDHSRLIFEGRGTGLDEVEETFATRLDVGAVLDVVRRPISRGRLSVLNASRTSVLFLFSFDAISHAPSSRRLTYLVDPVRVEGDVILDLRHRFKWGLISPHRVA
jgi:hypothetical protein